MAVSLPGMLEVEVVEISTSLKEQLGLQWPSSIVYGNATNSGMIDMASRGPMSFKISNPALSAAFNETSGKGNTLANPRLRVKNKEKAKIVIGEKLPVFSTSLVANVGSSSSVSYLDVGLKLDIEPVVSLDNEVTLKVALEVSSVTNAVTSGTNTAYQIGSRQASSVIRLRDGETQVFAGLIRDDDITAINGLPGLSRMPLLGRLFGQHTDTKNKTELALFITPRVIRNLELPDASVNFGAGGTETSPGTIPLRLNPASSASVPLKASGPSNPQNSFQRPNPGSPGINPRAVAPQVVNPDGPPPGSR